MLRSPLAYDFEQLLFRPRLALADGVADACRLAGDVSRRAERLLAAAPKLRAKGAGDVVKRLLDDDAVPGALTTKNLSRFAARRLFERLQTFEAVRGCYHGKSSRRIDRSGARSPA